jgi:hypothetical protein
MTSPDTTKPNNTNNARLNILILFKLVALYENSGNKFAINKRDQVMLINRTKIITGPEDGLLLKNPPG